MPNNQSVLIAILYTMPILLRRSPKRGAFLIIRLLALVAALAVGRPSPALAQAMRTIDHSVFDSLLRAHVVDGLVDYDAFRKAPAFTRYLSSLERASLERTTEDEQLAFWINVYNAYTIQLIVAHGERQSIRNINRTLGVFRLKGPWSEPLVRAAGRTLTLDEVEHRILRKNFQDARIHFALVSAARGSPPLRGEAYAGFRLADQLFDQGRVFLRDTTKNQIKRRNSRLSPIFTYYRTDFATTRAELGAFLSPWFEGNAKAMLDSAAFFPRESTFDWSLNSRAAVPRTP